MAYLASSLQPNLILFLFLPDLFTIPCAVLPTMNKLLYPLSSSYFFHILALIKTEFSPQAAGIPCNPLSWRLFILLHFLNLRIGEGSRFPYSFSLPLFYADLFFSWENLAHFITIASLSYRAVDFMKVDTSSFIFNYSA